VAEEPTFWQAAWTWIKRVFRWIAAPLPAILLVVGALILIVLGVKNIQIGGLLNKLFGKDDKDPKGKKAIDKANSIPEDRVDKDGKLIPLGEPDSKGHTQAVVVPIEEPGLFGDPDKIKVTPPGGETIEVELPDGVKAKDVDKVIITQPGDFVVTVKDSSGVEAEDVDSLLEKYGS
jgi:hypothetical protein